MRRMLTQNTLSFAMYAPKLQQTFSFCAGTAVRRLKFLLRTLILLHKGESQANGVRRINVHVAPKGAQCSTPHFNMVCILGRVCLADPGPTPCCPQIRWKSVALKTSPGFERHTRIPGDVAKVLLFRF